MDPIITLTMNSSVDLHYDVAKMESVKKLRASEPLIFPGGGGINVSRVIKELGSHSIAVFTAGGPTGQFLREMLDKCGLLTRIVIINENTRISATIFETDTGEEYRPTPVGPSLSDGEWQACFDALFEFEASYIVATGSLPVGVPIDFYARVAEKAKSRGTRVILDTSGDALAAALEVGVFLFKPNLLELETFSGRAAETPEEQDALARQFVLDRKAEAVAVSLGADGALLATRDGCLRLSAPQVEVKSAVGAGDSFVAGMTFGLSQGRPIADAFSLGLATGTATVLTAGSELAHRADVERLYQEIVGRPLQLSTAAAA
ncbi:1-phosphofructokinase family hexose kinase [Defluviicoccus vanus]|uniref:Phosphofructokinase n=1 Tax=Defluviicoccus vanus TaxID=111831 RepID=A0A7H1MZ52_9PROT|nr:1-phosphofructokinase family hexose kinase [Defluviicoccus vanus]QNT68738.1 1-phosphofructokinase family hexose kinase [Defluviicoccus vanus]